MARFILKSSSTFPDPTITVKLKNTKIPKT